MAKEQVSKVVGDTHAEGAAFENPFHLHFSGTFRTWLAREGVSLALTTYEGAKLIIVGPGMGGDTVVMERNFERCMATCVDGHRNIWISTLYQVWRLENGLERGYQLDGWDRIYMPRAAHVTGATDIHDLAVGGDGQLYGVVTGYNCVARIGVPGEKGSFSPYWRPPFIDKIIAEDRCHLNGFCMEGGRPAYASAVGTTNVDGAWRAGKADGGIVIDMRSNEIVARGLSMPHTPRLHDGALWFLEAGRGWLCRVDPRSGQVERLLWRPGFLRGLRFYGKFAMICCSAPRDETFAGLPLDEELAARGERPRCALEIVDLETMQVVGAVEISGTVKEIYDVAVLENCRQPLLHGILGEDVRNIVVLGPDETGSGALSARP